MRAIEPIAPRRMAPGEVDHIEVMCQADMGCEWWAAPRLRRVLRDLVAHIRYLEAKKKDLQSWTATLR